MARRTNSQFNIRSDFAKARASELARETGRSITQVVEDAVRAYVPEPPAVEVLPEGLVRKGRFLVLQGKGRKITMKDTNRMIEESRNRDLWGNCED